MDRDKRWDRVERAWDAIVDARAAFDAADASTALETAYARGENLRIDLIGSRLHARVPQAQVRRVIWALLAFSGASLLWRGLAGA